MSLKTTLVVNDYMNRFIVLGVVAVVFYTLAMVIFVLVEVPIRWQVFVMATSGGFILGFLSRTPEIILADRLAKKISTVKGSNEVAVFSSLLNLSEFREAETLLSQQELLSYRLQMKPSAALMQVFQSFYRR